MHLAAGATARGAALPWCVVLPTEPVTAMILRRERARAPRRRASRAPPSTSWTTIIGAVSRPSAGSLPSATTSSAGARLDRARLAKSWPSTRVALDGEEGLARAERAAVDRDAGDRLRHLARAAGRPWPRPASSTVQSKLMRARSCQRLAHLLMVGEGQRVGADDLAVLVALAGDDQRVARAAACATAARIASRRSPISIAPGRRRQDRGADRRRAPPSADCRR